MPLRGNSPSAPRPVEEKKALRRVGLRQRRPPAAGGGWLAVPCGGQGRKRPALGEPFGPGKLGIPSASLPAAAGSSAQGRERQRKEKQFNAMTTPKFTPHRARGTDPIQQSRPARTGRRLTGFVGTDSENSRRARRATAPERAQAAFSFGPCPARFLFRKTEKKMGGASRWTSPLREQIPHGRRSAAHPISTVWKSNHHRARHKAVFITRWRPVSHGTPSRPAFGAAGHPHSR